MAPRPPPGRNVPTRNPPAKGAPPKSGAPGRIKSGTGRKAKEKQKRQKPKVKRWLETKADWAKFEAWAKINAQPRKIPEPEPMVRASKPLSQMKKRIAVLSRPHKKREATCRASLGVSKKALTAKPSKRVLQLAIFVAKTIASCREFPIKISRAALRYKASRRIIEISRPHDVYLSEHCKTFNESQESTSRSMSDRRKRLVLAEKAFACPDLLTDEETDFLMTPGGIYRNALTYKFTSWMNYLSLPSYRFLKDRKDDQAKEWKEYILEQNETRGKSAWEAKMKKEEMKKKREKDEIRQKELEEKQQQKEVEETEPGGEGSDGKTGEDTGNIVTPAPEEKSEETAVDTSKEVERPGDAGQNLKKKESRKKMKNNEASKTPKNDEAADAENKEEEMEKEERAKKRKAERNAWRFLPSNCVDDPFAIKRSALKGNVSPRMAELAVAPVHKDRSCRKNPFAVRKSALEGPIPDRMAELAKPPHPRDPVEKPPPREKDSFGRPIYPKPPYGKKMPRVKPYQPAECPEKKKNDDDDNDDKKKKRKKRRSIDPIAYEATIDPCIDPARAKRQQKAREFAKEEMKGSKEAKGELEKDAEEKSEKENVPPPSAPVE